MSRYDKAARYAAAVIKHKLEVESTLTGGFDPTRGFSWHNVNSPEIIWPSEMRQSSNLETSFYPQQFGGSALVAPTQDLVDAFPMANGYPINDVAIMIQHTRMRDVIPVSMQQSFTTERKSAV